MASLKIYNMIPNVTKTAYINFVQHVIREHLLML